MSVISGYALEPIRAGQANGPFTQTPDNYVSDQAAFDAAYPSDETAPRVDYMVLVTSEGANKPGLLEFARYGYSKNEIIERFAYDAQAGAFKPLRGAAPIEVGVLGADSNSTNRLRVRPPLQATSAAPYRIAVVGSGGNEWSIAIVDLDTDFESPNNVPSRTVQLSKETGNLNWRTADLTTYQGLRVRFQQQQFFLPKDSTGRLGTAPISVTDPALMLNPIPGSGQIPRLRFGYGSYLTSVEVTSFSSVLTAGRVEWLRATGELKFHPTDASANAGIPVYYDGVLFADSLSLPKQTLGLITAPAEIAGLPPTGADLIFTVTGDAGYYRFPTVVYRSVFYVGKKGEVQVKVDLADSTKAQVQFSAADQAAYAGKIITLYFGDLQIERGISVRLLRNPVNLEGTSETKDVTEIYEVKGATWADPIIASPQVSLPSLPIDADAQPRTVRVIQGQGSYTDDAFPDLNEPFPSAGLGYYIDFDTGTFYFAQRKVDEIVPLSGASSDVVLEDPLLIPSNLELEKQDAPDGEYKPLTIGRDVLVDTTSGVVSLTSTHASVVTGTVTGSGFQFLSDSKANFITSGVQAGALVRIADSVYSVASVASPTALRLRPDMPQSATGAKYTIYENREILADRYFDEVILLDPTTKVERIRLLGVASNGERLSVSKTYAGSSGFRFGAEQSEAFATLVVVPNDSHFSTPAKGTVQLSLVSGNLHFASEDVGLPVYWARTLTPKFDFHLQPELGLVQFSERMLAGEEVRITYTVSPPSTIPPTLRSAPITEYARFLIRKEVTQDHPTPTSTLRFNKAGLTVAPNPAPSVFRGGRPQKLGTQCTVDAEFSQITFLPDDHKTDALPHGATVGPNERVYIDYYVTQAVGGEKTFTVLQPPLLTAVVMINETDSAGNLLNAFKVHGDQTARFPGGALMRIESEQIYLLGSSSYDASANKTTVTLYDSGSNPDGFSQFFLDTFADPKVYVSSGPTPITSAAQTPAYFVEVTEPTLRVYDSVARGSNTLAVPLDQTSSYRPGTVLLFTDSTGSFSDFLQVTGSAYDVNTNRTTIALSTTAVRQYVYGAQILKRSVRPVFEPPILEAQTSLIPKLAQPHFVYRQVSGQPGEVLKPSEYTIDDTGHVVFAEALRPAEEFAICYTGLTQGSDGLNLRISYTSQIAPTAANGLLGQTLLADYYIRSPDSFYFRVEPMENFRGEYAAEITASASSGSSGPQTSNASQPKLWEQGRKSLYFDERHLANQDRIARTSLLYFNDLINSLETYRRNLDGTVVGNNDGLFLFDGETGRTSLSQALANQIDDAIKVSDTLPSTVVKKHYNPGPTSRFYSTAQSFFGVTTDTSTASVGAEVLDTKSTNVTQVSNLRYRQAWGVVVEPGTSTLRLDLASGNEPEFAAQSQKYARRPFKEGMKCRIVSRSGAIIASSVTIATGGVSNYQVTIAGGSGTVPAGATIYQLQSDDSKTGAVPNMVTHVFGRDYSFNGESGQITYVPSAGDPATNSPLARLKAYSGSIALANTLTEPRKIPVLFGGIEDDDGDLSFPVQTPDTTVELATYYASELRLIRSSTGLLRTWTTEPKISIGTVLAPNFRTIVDGNISTMSPAPLPGDLVRITTGANAGSGFRRIVTVGSNYLITDATAPVFVASANFSYQLIVGANIALGTATGGTATTLINTAANFSGLVRVGYTLIVSVGGVNYRRQINMVANTMLTFYPALPSPVIAGAAYRVTNPLSSYGNRSGIGTADLLQEWDAALMGEQASYVAKQDELQPIIDKAAVGVSFFGLSQETVTSLETLKQSIPTLTAASIPAWRTKFAPVSVVGFDAANIFVMDIAKEDLDTRESQIGGRVDPIAQEIIPKLVDILANTEKLYDKRYVWIDARINLEHGLLVRQETAVRNRIKAQAEAIKQLMKLLSMGSA
jgi:hypothetical protein